MQERSSSVNLRPSLLLFLFARIAGRSTVTEVATTLGASGIPVMPLKGVLLHATVYEDSDERDMVDVDVLVPRRFRTLAQRLLIENDWRVTNLGPSSTMLVKASRPLPLDLHFAPYSIVRYGPSAVSLFEHARRDSTLFGAEVLIPRPEDTYAHLVGHFAKDRRDQRQAASLADFRAVARRYRMDAGAIARHLEENGLARAARYALGLARDHADDSFAGEVLERLKSDPLGDLVARIAIAVVQNRPQPSKLAVIPSALLAPSLWQSAAVLGAHLATAAKREVRRHRRS